MIQANGEAGKNLQRRLADHPRLPKATRHVMRALATETAEPAWDFFGHDDAMVGRVLNLVRQAFEQSLAEVSRPTSTHEVADIKSVIKKARALQSAIKNSSLPGNWVRLDHFELEAEDMPSVPLDLGWHSLRSEGYANGYPLAIFDVLEWAIELAQNHMDSLPVRALERHKEQPELTAFVRLLAWHFNREFQQEHHTAIGHIASAVFDLTVPLDARGVEARLRTRPKPFAS